MTVAEQPDQEERAWKAYDDLVARRYREARDAGLSRQEARAFALSRLDIGELRRLLDRGCDPRTAARILL